MQIWTPYLIDFGVLQKKIKKERLPQEQEPVSSFGAESKSKSDLMLLGYQHTSG